MSELKKATLQQLPGDPTGKPLGKPVPVQFNPATLKFQLSNTVAGGNENGQPAKQYTGSSSTTLSLDLVFDTADEGTTAEPRSVLDKTAVVEAFLLPVKLDGTKQVPPRARFQWGTMIVDGVIDALTIDLDHFAANGTPLRAKVSLSLREQKPELQLLKSGPGANATGGAPAAGGLGGEAGIGLAAGAVGSVGIGLGLSAQAGFAIGGETAAGFAARVGLDAAAWRGLSFGDANPLSLSAGLEIGFSADLNVSTGVGVALGVSAGVAASADVSFGLDASAGAAAGFAVAAGGGVSASLATVRTAANDAQQAGEKQAFSLPAPAVAPPRPGLPEQARPALVQGGLPPSWADAPPAPPPPRVDARAASFGSGIPLRTTVGVGAGERAAVVQGSAPVKTPAAATGNPPTTPDRSVAPWVALPPPGSTTATRRGSRAKACGCRSACGCGCS